MTSVIPKYTIDEENWLQGKLQIFDECWKRVPSGEDLVNDFIMFTYDVPLSKSFVPDHLAIFNERYLTTTNPKNLPLVREHQGTCSLEHECHQQRKVGRD